MKVVGNIRFKLFFLTLLLVTSYLLPNHVYAENEFSLRVFPSIDFPVLSQFDIGVGGSGILDWSFITLNKFNFGVSAGAGYFNMPVKTGDTFAFVDFMFGGFARYRPLDRLSLQANILTGVYQFSMKDTEGVVQEYIKAIFMPSVSVEFYLTPFLSLFAEGRASFRVFSETMPFTSFGGSAGIRINITEFISGRTRIHIEKSQQYRIFPVSWAWYEHNPVAAITVTNEESNVIRNINLSFYMESYMGQPYTFAVIPQIPSGGSVEVPVTALFNEVMLNLSENITANGEIQVRYSSLGSIKEAVIPIQMPVFTRNTLSWDDDRRAAAFVSPRDSAARLFSRYVVSAVNLYKESGGASAALHSYPQNVLYAMALFETLRIYGISYVVDPAMSFAVLSADDSALDLLTYPYESLYYRGGDCGHLSILFCSLLETLGIDTAFITVPGHIYIAFDVGDNAWEAGNQNIIEIQNEDGTVKRWLPLEITVPNEGFTRAWRIGARQWRTLREHAELLPLRDCWEVYPSVTVNNSVDYPPEMPAAEEIIRAVEAELRR